MSPQISPRSLLSVDPDVTMMIFDELQRTSPRSVASLALVHSSFKKLAQQCQYREVEFNHSVAACTRLNHINQQQLLPAIRSLKVMGDAVENHQVSWPLLAELVPRMRGLKDITITSKDIPAVMIKAVEKHPNAHLHIVVSHQGSGDCLTLMHLKGVANLYSLQIDAIYIDTDCLKVTEPLRDILLSCSNLRLLKLDIHQPRSGCVVYGIGQKYLGCGFKNGQRPPPLEALELIEYPFGCPATEGDDGDFVDSWDGYPENRDEEDYWADTFDWTRLQRLRLRSAWFALALLPHLTALKEAEILDFHNSEDIKAFYSQISTRLERISAPTLESIGIDGILRHSSQLRALQLHRKEDGSGTWRENAVDAGSLRVIRDHCQQIEELDIDVARDGEWPYEVLDVLASFPRLTNLKLRLELGSNSDGNPVQPPVTFSSSGMLFKYLREHSQIQPSRLRELHVVSGSPRDVGLGYPDPDEFWSGYNSSTFICSLSERDDEGSQGLYTTTCPHLDAIENRVLQLALRHGKGYVNRQVKGLGKKAVSTIGDLLSGGRLRSKDSQIEILGHWANQESLERLQVAWRGPTPQRMWEPHY